LRRVTPPQTRSSGFNCSMADDEAEVEDVHDVTGFLRAVFDFSEQDDVLYRGQRKTRWNLEPTLARMEIRNPAHTPLSVERELISRFRRQYFPHVSRELKHQWDILALAQHHGLNTRMLDWSTNPLAALWFAVRKPAEGEPGAVFMIEPEQDDYADAAERAYSPYAINRTMFFQPTHLNQRIVAQAGWFSVHSWSEADGAFSRLDRVARYTGRIKRLRIQPEDFSTMRRDLDQLAVNEATLFPDLDGLCTHLNWSHTLLSDEVDPPDATEDLHESPDKPNI
jgi:FRG domain